MGIPYKILKCINCGYERQRNKWEDYECLICKGEMQRKRLEEEYVFIDFKVVKLIDWLNDHRECKTETIVGKTENQDGFRFIACKKCNEVYFAGKV